MNDANKKKYGLSFENLLLFVDSIVNKYVYKEIPVI